MYPPFAVISLTLTLAAVNARPNNLTRTVPMGWMSWQAFRCETDCATFPSRCISERLYKEMASALVSGEYLSAGYDTIHLDDCIVAKQRDASNRLTADEQRFPSGFQTLGDTLHGMGVKFGFYTAISKTTCGGYPGTAPGLETIDAQTFSEWGVDYLKADVSR